MPCSVQEIETDFLDGKISTIALPPEAILASFERIEKIFGRDWILSQMSGKGIMPTMPIIDMGVRLNSLEGISDTDKLFDSIRQGEQNADAELSAIHLIRSSQPAAQIELYPPADGRVADFRVRLGDEEWTTVEVTQPNNSEEKKRLQSILKILIDALSKVQSQCVLEVLFIREPTDEEVAVLGARLPDFCALQGPQRATLHNELGFLFLNQGPINQITQHDVPGHENTPITGVTVFTGGGANGGPLNQISIRMPFSDDRAQEILAGEAKQLPKQGRGLIMIDVGAATGSFQLWAPTFAKRFQPTLHTRVSGVCRFERSAADIGAGYEWLFRTQLVQNPHAQFQLPEWIPTAVAQAGEAFTRSGLPVR